MEEFGPGNSRYG